MISSKITEEEYQRVIDALTERLKEPIANQFKKFLPKSYLEELLTEPDSEVQFKFTVRFKMEDLIQIVMEVGKWRMIKWR